MADPSSEMLPKQSALGKLPTLPFNVQQQIPVAKFLKLLANSCPVSFAGLSRM
jgi:hypothetical protein